MIFYIASYPRSGNSLVQQIIQAFLQQPITTVYTGSRKPQIYAKENHPFIKHWRIPNYNLATRLMSKFDIIQRLKRHLAYYDLAVPPHTQNMRYLMPGCLTLLKPQTRKYLAKLPSPFFIKTHEPPFDTYFPNEKIIFPFRHPGAVVWSYHNYLRDITKKECNIVDIINGNTPHGSWATYHQKWLQISSHIPGQILPLYFKENLESPKEAAKKLAAFTNIPFYKDGHLLSLEKLQEENPNHIRSGKIDEWKSQLNDAEQELISISLEPTFKILSAQTLPKAASTTKQIND